MSANVLAGLAAALGGGMKAFNAQRQEDEATRQFNVQEDRQKRLLERALARDELEELRTTQQMGSDQLRDALTVAQQFGGQRLPSSAVANLPDNLRDLISKPAMSLESRQISGALGTPGSNEAGGLTFTKKDAAPIAGQVDINMPESERARIAQGNQLAAFQRAQVMAGGREADRDASTQRFLMSLTQNQQQHQDRLAATYAGIAARGAGRDTMTSGQEFNAINTLNRVYNTNTKAARTIQDQFARMDQAMRTIDRNGGVALNAPSQAVLVTFQKILDPESVVRESEYARSPQGLALIDRLKGSLAAVQVGGPGVPPEQLREFYGLAKTFHDRATASMEAERKRVEAHAKRFNLPMELIVADYDGSSGAATPPTPTAPSAPSAAPTASKFKITKVQ